MSARKSPSIDKQGIRRGKCTQCSTCQGYSSDKGLTCGKCRHPPTKHENLDVLKAPLQVFPSRPHPPTTVQQPYSSAISTDVYHIPKVTHSPSSSRSSLSPPPSFGTTMHHSASLLPTSSPSLSLPSTLWPQCKATGCTDPVFYCDKMGYFEYCSPQCRDEHYLPGYNRSLDNDIKTNTPQPTAMATSSQQQHHQTSIDTSFASTAAKSPSDRLMNNGGNLLSHNTGGSSSSHDTSHDAGGSLLHDTGGSSLHNMGGSLPCDIDVGGSSSHDAGSLKEVTIELEAKEELKLLLKDDGSNEGSKDSRIIIVGASSPKSLDWFCDRKLCLLDCIVSVNGESFQSASEVFEYAKTRTKLDMVLDRTSSVTTNDLFFDKLKEYKVNKVVCIKSNGGQVGFNTNRNKTVKDVSIGSEAEKAGLKKDDKLRAYAAVNKHGQCEDICKLHSNSLNSDLETAFKKNHHVVLGLFLKGSHM